MNQTAAWRRLRRLTVVLGACASTGLALGGTAWAGSAAPIITDFAGTGASGTPVAGPASSSPLGQPNDVTIDADGDVYIADAQANVIEKITPSGQLSIVAGDGSAGAPTPGPATSSALDHPEAVAVDSSGNLYIADTNNDVIEKVTPSGTLSIIVGNGSIGGIPHGGPATSVPQDDPGGVAVDSSGNVYISDTDASTVEAVTPQGQLSIIAGTGALGAPTPGPATSSDLAEPEGLAVDPSGDVYVADPTNSVVEKVTPGGELSIFAGNGTYGAPVPGPATSSPLGAPWGVALDPSGHVYLADYGDSEVEEVSPGGSLSIVAGNGSYGSPSYGAAATSSELSAPEGLAVEPGGTIVIADTYNDTVDRIGFATPGPAGQPTLTPGDTTAQLTFIAPTDPGTSAITGYEVSLDGGQTWQTLSVTPGSGDTLSATLTGLTDGTTYSVEVRAVNGSGAGMASPVGSVTPQSSAPAAGPPVVTAPPAVSGTGALGQTLACSTGSWSGSPNGYGYQWRRDGVAIPGATGSSYLVGPADEGHALTCTVTAGNGSGTASSTSSAVKIPIARRDGCPAPSGRLAGRVLGPVWLGETRAQARGRLPRFEVYNSYTDNYCLAGGAGIRVGYASAERRGRASLARAGGRVVLALTANPYYALDGVRPGASITAARHQLRFGAAIRWGANDWYIIPGATTTVIKARHGVIEEIGLADAHLADTRGGALRLLRNF